MERKAVSGMMLTLLLISMLTLVFDIQPVKASGTIYIRADGSVDPPTAPIQRDGDIYTFTDNIFNETIVVERGNIVVDGNAYTLQGIDAAYSQGIRLSGIGNVTIKNTNIKDFDRGIYLVGSSNNIIYRNNITSNDYGIDLMESSNNSILGNALRNIWGVKIYGSSSKNNTISGNTIGVGLDGITIYGGAHAPSLTTISGNSITANARGIRLLSNNNIVSGNNITNGWGPGNGMEVAGTNNTVSGNNIANNAGNGFVLSGGFSNVVSGNSLRNNGASGVVLGSSSNNSISENTVANNGEYGINLGWSSNNRIYHNNFSGNTWQVYSLNSNNTWDDGYPSGGNYWSEYSDHDFYSGPNQDEAGSDRIWDNPYVIDANNTDRYPLTKAYGGPHDIGITNVTTSKPVIGQGYSLDINVTIVNYGIYSETFNVTPYADATPIQNQINVTLTSRNSTTITFTWNTTSFATGNYIISAVATPVPGETFTADNSYIYGTVSVRIPVHDVAITGITPSTPMVAQDDVVSIYVTVEQQGAFTETFNVTAYANTTLIGTQMVTILTSTTLTFNWNTTGATLGNYVISAYATQVPDENDTADNSYIDGTIKVVEWIPKGQGIFVFPRNNVFNTLTTPSYSRFNVTIWVGNVSDLYAYQVTLFYNSTLLNATQAWKPTWDPQWVFYGRTVVGTLPWFGLDYVGLGEVILSGPTFIGTGLLGIIEFEIIYGPTQGNVSSILDIDNTDTYLLDPALNIIPSPKTNGYYEYNYVLGIHDIAVTDVVPSETVVGQGYSMSINVTVENQGNLAESFNVTAYADQTVPPIGDEITLGNQTVTLNAGNSKTLTFLWNTTGVPDGNYIISAYAWPIPNETDTADNMLADGSVIVTSTSVLVNPSILYISINQTLLITVDVQNITDLYAWEFKLHYNTTVLDAVNYTEGTFLSEIGWPETLFSWDASPYYEPLNDTLGHVWLWCTLVAALNGVNGSGTLAVIKLKATSIGVSYLTFTKVILLDGTVTNEIVTTIYHGTIVVVKLLGDINGDGKVDIRDIAFIAKRFGASLGDANYHPQADITGTTPLEADGTIDIRDIATVAKEFGKVDP